MSKVSISATIEEEVNNGIRSIAVKQDRPFSYIVNLALRKYIAETKKKK